MRLRKPCEHDRYEWHNTVVYGADRVCPGGEFLPEDALLIWWCEEHESSSVVEASRCWWFDYHESGSSDWGASLGKCRMVEKFLIAASQVGEPGTFKPSRRHEALLEYLNEETP